MLVTKLRPFPVSKMEVNSCSFFSRGALRCNAVNFAINSITERGPQ